MIKNACLALAAVTALAAGSAQAASDFLLRVAGISGSSMVPGFEDYFDIDSWSLGFTRGMCQNLSFVKFSDAASADITAATLTGTFFPTATLVGRKTGGDGAAFTYLRLTLFNSVFTSIQLGGSAGSNILPVEQISMSPSSVKYEAFQQDQSGVPQLVATTTVNCQKVK